MAPVKKPQSSSARKPRKPTGTTSKPNRKSKDRNRPPPTQVKTKRTTISTPSTRKPKQPSYTDAQLNLPAINSIVPAHAAPRKGKGAGKKRDKVYVDDTESMMTILAMVNAEKEGMIESKVLKARQMEEIREARRKDAEKRAEGRRGRLEEVKIGLKKRGRKGGKEEKEEKGEGVDGEGKRKKRKSVSFA